MARFATALRLLVLAAATVLMLAPAWSQPSGQAASTNLEPIKLELDRYWDLMRQRRARRAAGQDPEGASARDPDTLKHYLQ